MAVLSGAQEMTLTLDDARNVATVVATLIALAAVVPNLLAVWRSLRSKIYFDTVALLEGKDDELRNLRHLLEGQLKLAKDNNRPFDILKVSLELQKKLDQLARVYDKIGLLVKHRVIPTEFLFDFYSRPIIIAWQHISPLISQERTSRIQPNHMVKFEIVAAGAALYRQGKYKEHPPFPISPQAGDAWRRWKPWRGRPRISGV